MGAGSDQSIGLSCISVFLCLPISSILSEIQMEKCLWVRINNNKKRPFLQPCLRDMVNLEMDQAISPWGDIAGLVWETVCTVFLSMCILGSPHLMPVDFWGLGEGEIGFVLSIDLDLYFRV